MNHQRKNDEKTTHRSSTVSGSRVDGRHGESISPPSYGMDALDRGVLQRQTASTAAETGTAAHRANPTGLPDRLKNGVEALSGYSLDNVRVHYNSPKPAQLNALAYTQGTEIHVAPGQERHLPHEAWHVVQQAQGRVQPTMQMKGVGVNDDAGLEREADVMGGRAAFATVQMQPHIPERTAGPANTTVQRQHEVWGRKKIVWNYIRAAGHFVGGTFAILAGAGVTPTGFGTPAGAIGIIYGVVKEIKGFMVAIPDAIHTYARSKNQKLLSKIQQLVIATCNHAKTVLDTIGAILSINWRKAVNIVLTAVSQLLRWVAWLADKGGQYHGLPEKVQHVLAWLSTGASNLSEAISHINAFLNTAKWDEILAAVYGVVKTILGWFESIYQTYKEKKGDPSPMDDSSSQTYAALPHQAGSYPYPAQVGHAQHQPHASQHSSQAGASSQKGERLYKHLWQKATDKVRA